MKRTIRLLAVPAATTLLLASCGASDEAAPAKDTSAQEAAQADAELDDSEQDDESDSWPIVEDEDGNVVEHPEDDAAEEVEDDGAFSLTDEPLFASTSTGAQITMTVDAQPGDSDEIAWLEQYREDVNGEPVTYVLSDVDNRDGSELINMYNISFYDEEGLEWACGGPDTYVDEVWKPVWLYGSTDKDEYETSDGEPMDYDEGEELSRRANEFEFSSGVSPFERNTMVSICPTVIPDRAVAVEVMPGGIVLDPVYATPESYMGEDG